MFMPVLVKEICMYSTLNNKYGDPKLPLILLLSSIIFSLLLHNTYIMTNNRPVLHLYLP